VFTIGTLSGARFYWFSNARHPKRFGLAAGALFGPLLVP
jgi:hypothetical protein